MVVIIVIATTLFNNKNRLPEWAWATMQSSPLPPLILYCRYYDHSNPNVFVHRTVLIFRTWHIQSGVFPLHSALKRVDLVVQLLQHGADANQAMVLSVRTHVWMSLSRACPGEGGWCGWARRNGSIYSTDWGPARIHGRWINI